MPYEVLEKQIKALPDAAFEELSRYIDYLSFRYTKQNDKTLLTNKINDFLQKNPIHLRNLK